MSSPPHRKIRISAKQLHEQIMVLPAATTSAGGGLQAQTVTLTLTQNPDDGKMKG